MEGHLVNGLLLSYPARTNSDRSVSQRGMTSGGFDVLKGSRWSDCACAEKLVSVNVKL